ncbi:hypothetical protein HY251_13515 [bacterium]|nr:hypothetical protein [bacterium]
MKLDRLLALTAAASETAPGATNLLPVALRAAHHAHLGRPVLALRREDRLELEAAPRPEPELALTILDATASPDLLRAAFPGFNVLVSAPIALARPAKARLIQYVDRSFSRESVKGATEIAEAARVVAGAIRLHVRDPERPTLGLVTYKHIVEPLTRAILAEVEDLALAGSLHFGGLRGKNALEGVDVLVVLGTPRPNPAAIEVRAIGLAEEAGGKCDSSRGESGVEVLAYGGRRVRRYRGSKDGAYAVAEEHAISAELLQAIGRQRLERHGGITLLFSSWPLPLPKGAVEIRSAREDGLVTDPRRAAAYEVFEGKLLPALAAVSEGLTSKEAAEVTGVDQRHLCRYLEPFLKHHREFGVDRSTYPARLKGTAHAVLPHV